MPLHTRSILALAAVACSVFALLPRAHGQMDEVSVNKKINRGTITAMTASEITLDQGGVARKYPVNEITKQAW